MRPRRGAKRTWYDSASIKNRNATMKEAVKISHALQVIRRVVPIIAMMVVCVMAAGAQENPYRVAEGWAKLPAGVMWGAVISVDVDARGNLWVFHRSEPTILEFDPSGKLIKSFGKDMFVQAHGMT